MKPHEKPPSEVEMTDGCGFANAALMRYLREYLSWEVFPTVVQCRIAGAKVINLREIFLLVLISPGSFTSAPERAIH